MKSIKKYHRCEEFDKLNKLSNDYMREYEPAFDSKNKFHGEYGQSIIEIINYNNEEYWWASCNEYATMIKYCPFCGDDLTKKEE